MTIFSVTPRWVGWVLILLVSCGGWAQTVVPRENFPTPAAGALRVVGTTLHDGRLLVWNGNAIFRQQAVGADAFDAIATGYLGTPAFITLSPNGQTAILGAGETGELYRFDVSDPADYTDAQYLGVLSHRDGVFLSSSLLLLDAIDGPQQKSVLVIIDIGETKKGATVVVEGASKALVVDRPEYSLASLLTLDPVNERVYAMDANQQAVRYFPIPALLQAYQSGTVLQWAWDGIAIGPDGLYYTGGVAGIAPSGALIIGGASPADSTQGGIQLVNPDTGIVLDTLTPSEKEGAYALVYNPATAIVTARVSDETLAIHLSPQAAAYTNYPAVATGSVRVVQAALPGGNTLLWNGTALFRSLRPRADAFDTLATGYDGAPAFAQWRSNAEDVLLGAGLAGELVLFDPEIPTDFSLDKVVGNSSHFSGVCLDEEHVLLDVENTATEASVLKIVKLADEQSKVDSEWVMEKPQGALPAAVAVDETRGAAYAMDAHRRELRAFSVQTLVSAFSSASSLYWQDDGDLIGEAGDYFNGGVAGVAPDGNLLIGGLETVGERGGIQVVSPDTGNILLTVQIENYETDFYHVQYNPITAMISARVQDITFAIDYLQLDVPEDSGEGEGEGQSEGEGEGAVEGEGEGALEGEGEGQEEGEGEGQQEGEGEGAAEGEEEGEGEEEVLSVSDTARVLLTDFSYLDRDGSGGLSFIEAQYGVPGITQAQFDQIDTFSTSPNELTRTEVWLASYNLDKGLIALLLGSFLSIAGVLYAEGGGGPCFIATAAYGTPLTAEIDVLRAFRDAVLLENPVGTAFVDSYYRLSPPLADWIAQHPLAAASVRVLLCPVILLAHFCVAIPDAMVFIALLILFLKLHRSRKPRFLKQAIAV